MNDFLISYTCFWNPSDCSLPIFHTCCRSWAAAAVTLQQQPLPLSPRFGHSLCGSSWLDSPHVSCGCPKGILLFLNTICSFMLCTLIISCLLSNDITRRIFAWMINRLQADEKLLKCTKWTRPWKDPAPPKSAFLEVILSYTGLRPPKEMYIPLPAVIRHDSLSKWQIMVKGPKWGRVSPRGTWSKLVAPFSLVSKTCCVFLEHSYHLVDLLSKLWYSFKGLYARLIPGNVSNDECTARAMWGVCVTP